MEKPWVYIASPYTKGDQALNVRFQHRVWHTLLDLDCIPIAPLWSHYQHIALPRRYQDWIDYDLEIIKRCDACLRLSARCDVMGYVQAESAGADGEVRAFMAAGKPVFASVESLETWLAWRREQ